MGVERSEGVHATEASGAQSESQNGHDRRAVSFVCWTLPRRGVRRCIKVIFLALRGLLAIEGVVVAARSRVTSEMRENDDYDDDGKNHFASFFAHTLYATHPGCKPDIGEP